MKQHEQANLFMRKAAQDEALLDQAAEKLLKALLSASGGTIRKTHDFGDVAQ